MEWVLIQLLGSLYIKRKELQEVTAERERENHVQLQRMKCRSYHRRKDPPQEPLEISKFLKAS